MVTLGALCLALSALQEESELARKGHLYDPWPTIPELTPPTHKEHKLIVGDCVVFHMAFQLRVLIRESGFLWRVAS